MDLMFHDVAVDGSTAFIREQSKHADEQDEDDPYEDHDGCTPVSSNSRKRESSTGTAASSPTKKSKSPPVRTMKKFMCENTKIQAERNMMLQKH